MILEAFGRTWRGAREEYEEEKQTSNASADSACKKHEQGIHYREAAPLYPDLQHTEQACEARETLNLMTTCDIFATCG